MCDKNIQIIGCNGVPVWIPCPCDCQDRLSIDEVNSWLDKVIDFCDFITEDDLDDEPIWTYTKPIENGYHVHVIVIVKTEF